MNLLKGQLGKVAKSEGTSEVGMLLIPESGTVLTEIEGSCLTITKDDIEGSVIGEVSPVGKVQGTGEIIFKISGKNRRYRNLKVDPKKSSSKIHSASKFRSKAPTK